MVDYNILLQIRETIFAIFWHFSNSLLGTTVVLFLFLFLNFSESKQLDQKVSSCHLLPRHFTVVPEKKSFWLSRKFFSVFKNAENRDIFAVWRSDNHFLLTCNHLSLGEFSNLSEIGRPFFLFSTIQSFMAGFFCVLILPNAWQVLIA